MILRSRELRAGAGEWTRHSETLVTADRLDPLRRDRNDGNSAYWPPRGTSARSRACARRNYARRLSRDGDNSRSRLRSLIETRPSLSLSLSLSLVVPPLLGHMERVKTSSATRTCPPRSARIPGLPGVQGDRDACICPPPHPPPRRPPPADTSSLRGMDNVFPDRASVS
jgi:hypothetical protein